MNLLFYMRIAYLCYFQLCRIRVCEKPKQVITSCFFANIFNVRSRSFKVYRHQCSEKWTGLVSQSDQIYANSPFFHSGYHLKTGLVIANWCSWFHSGYHLKTGLVIANRCSWAIEPQSVRDRSDQPGLRQYKICLFKLMLLWRINCEPRVANQ